MYVYKYFFSPALPCRLAYIKNLKYTFRFFLCGLVLIPGAWSKLKNVFLFFYFIYLCFTCSFFFKFCSFVHNPSRFGTISCLELLDRTCKVWSSWSADWEGLEMFELQSAPISRQQVNSLTANTGRGSRISECKYSETAHTHTQM